MRFDIRYRCRFLYDQLVRESQNELRACPTSDRAQQLVSYRVTTTPSARVLSFTDYFGTRVDAFGAREPHLALDVVAEATVETQPRPLVAVNPVLDALRDPGFRDEHVEYLAPSPHADWGSAVAGAAAEQAAMAGPGVVGRVLAVHRYVSAILAYVPGSTYVGVEVDEVLRRREGVCQDFAHMAVAMCRSLDIPARYVSGYLFTVDESVRPPSAAGDGEDEPDAVRVQTHAWFEAAVPGFGWLALDPTNGADVGLRHVKIGHGRDYDDVQPMRGVFAGVAHCDLEVTVDIRRLGSPAVLPPLAERSERHDREAASRSEDEALRRAAESQQQQQQQQ